jgi:hypothetical protein
MKSKSGTDKPWGGRFAEKTAPAAEKFSASVHFDMRLYRYDIAGSKAHAKMLAKVGLLSGAELKQILGGLTEIESEIESNRWKKWARQGRNSTRPGVGTTRSHSICGYICGMKASILLHFSQICRKGSFPWRGNILVS